MSRKLTEKDEWEKGADYYSTTEDDCALSADCLGEALHDWFHDQTEGEEPETVTVHAFTRVKFGEREVENWAHQLHENLDEWFQEHYGNPDDCPPTPRRDETSSTREALKGAVRDYVSGQTVWRCDRIGEATFTLEEVRLIIGEAK